MIRTFARLSEDGYYSPQTPVYLAQIILIKAKGLSESTV